MQPLVELAAKIVFHVIPANRMKILAFATLPAASLC
jgi:hypothetical protein